MDPSELKGNLDYRFSYILYLKMCLILQGDTLFEGLQPPNSRAA